MRLYIIGIGLIFFNTFSFGQDITLFAQKGNMAGTLLNPAFSLDKKFNIVLGSFNAEIGTDGPSLHSITSKNSDGSRFLDKSKFDKNFESENNLYTQFELRTLDVGMKLGTWGILAGHGFKIQSNFSFSEDLAQLLFLGNAPFIGQNLSVGPSLDVLAYNEVYLGAQKTVGRFTVGGKLKLLYGTVNTYTEKSNIQFTTDEEYYRWDFDTDLLVRGSGTIAYNSIDNVNYTVPEFSFENFFYNNRGWAFDLGVVFKPTENLTFSASALDIGSIQWDFFPRKYTSRGKFSFDGLDIFDISEVTENSLIDTLNQLFKVSQQIEEYNTPLNSTFALGASYVQNKWTYSALYQLRHNFGYRRNIVSLSAVRQFKFLDLGMQMMGNKNDFLNIGVYSNVNLKYFTFYVAVHNLVYGFDWTKSNNFSLRGGATIQF